MSNAPFNDNSNRTHTEIVELLGVNLVNLQLHRDFLYNNSAEISRHFDMSAFCNLSTTAEYCIDKLDANEVNYFKYMGLDIDCGTSMCVVGWAPSNPALRSQIDELNAEGKGIRGLWFTVTELFINREREVGLFDYLFGEYWDNDLSVAIERMDIVIDAVSTSSFNNAVLLAALANSEMLQNDRSVAHADYLEHYSELEFLDSVRNDVEAIYA